MIETVRCNDFCVMLLTGRHSCKPANPMFIYQKPQHTVLAAKHFQSNIGCCKHTMPTLQNRLTPFRMADNSEYAHGWYSMMPSSRDWNCIHAQAEQATLLRALAKQHRVPGFICRQLAERLLQCNVHQVAAAWVNSAHQPLMHTALRRAAHSHSVLFSPTFFGASSHKTMLATGKSTIMA